MGLSRRPFPLLFSAALAVALVSAAAAQSARLELRLVAQSGLPGVAGLNPTGCVFDDQPGVVAVTPGVAKRLEVQARVVDTDPADNLAIGGLVSLTFRVVSSRAGLWQRSLLSAREAASVADPPAFNTGVDCSGASGAAWRGLHNAFRGWSGGLPNNEDSRNGTINAGSLTGIRAEAVDALSARRWVALYTFDYALPVGQGGDVGLSVRAESISGVAFVWTTADGQVFDGTESIGAGLLLSAAAGPTACCARGNCYIALTPTACFGNGGRLSASGAAGCVPTSCCAGDFNRDGVQTVQDVFDFVGAYLDNDPRADTDASGSLTSQDVFDFLGFWFAACG